MKLRHSEAEISEFVRAIMEQERVESQIDLFAGCEEPREPLEEDLELLKQNGPYKVVGPGPDISETCSVCGRETRKFIMVNCVNRSRLVTVCTAGSCHVELVDKDEWNRACFSLISSKCLMDTDEEAEILVAKCQKMIDLRSEDVAFGRYCMKERIPLSAVEGILGWWSERKCLTDKQKWKLADCLLIGANFFS